MLCIHGVSHSDYYKGRNAKIMIVGIHKYLLSVKGMISIKSLIYERVIFYVVRSDLIVL